MPDGTAFDIPKQDNVPAARPFEEHFTLEQQTLDIYFALPMIAEHKANVSSSPDSREAVRYRNNVVTLSDEVLGKQQKEIEIGDFNFRILFGDESRDNYSSMQVARLIRTGSGEIEVDETYVPPLLQIGASQILLDRMRSLLELLLAKNSSLSQGRKQLEGGFAEFSSAEDTAFRLLHTLNAYTPLLNYYHFVPDVHPYILFTHLIQFTGALCTFSSEVTIKMLPKYEHSNVLSVFMVFDKLIRKILGGDVSAGCVNIPIEEVSPASYVCNITDAKLFSTGEFYFGVAADVPDKELIVGTLSRIKMCSRDKLELIIPSAMPGLPLKHVPKPPEGLSVKPGFIYFRLDQQGDFWEGIKTSGNIAFYFPHQYSNVRMEMLVLRS
jgi:type VI secretion system protein ImpJ